MHFLNAFIILRFNTRELILFYYFILPLAPARLATPLVTSGAGVGVLFHTVK